MDRAALAHARFPAGVAAFTAPGSRAAFLLAPVARANTGLTLVNADAPGGNPGVFFVRRSRQNLATFEVGRTKHGVAATRLHGMSTSRPRRRRESTEYPRARSGRSRAGDECFFDRATDISRGRTAVRKSRTSRGPDQRDDSLSLHRVRYYRGGDRAAPRGVARRRERRRRGRGRRREGAREPLRGETKFVDKTRLFVDASRGPARQDVHRSSSRTCAGLHRQRSAKKKQDRGASVAGGAGSPEVTPRALRGV